MYSPTDSIDGTFSPATSLRSQSDSYPGAPYIQSRKSEQLLATVLVEQHVHAGRSVVVFSGRLQV